LLPAYRKGPVIREVVDRIISYPDAQQQYELRVLVVLDGPDYETVVALSGVDDTKVTLLQLPQNMGKGFALKSGSKLLDGDVVVLFDADLDIQPKSAFHGVAVVLSDDKREIGCAYGSKFHEDSVVLYPLSRRILSRIFNRLVRILCRVKIEDSQVGVKVLHQTDFKTIAEKCIEKRFLFDVELLHHASQHGRRLEPIPVELTHHFDSTIDLKEILRMGIGLLGLAARLRKGQAVASDVR
jgi:glycosyltransferase involved in cell wall biosynthesis